jgi:nitroreductase
MTFSKSIFEIISSRKSVRNYTGDMIPDDVLKKIEAFIERIPESPLGGKVRFQWVAASEDDVKALKGLGTYGVIHKPAGFVIGATEKSDTGLVDFGYRMEAIVLYLTDLGLGSCWLGGSFAKSRFSEWIGAAETECVPCVVSFGVPVRKTKTMEKIVRKGAGSDTRKPFEALFFRSDFTHSLTPAEAGRFARILKMVRIGPSASNRQSWRIVRDSNSDIFHFYVQRDKLYTQVLKWFRVHDLPKVDMGIAACHFELAAKETGLSGQWMKADPGLAELPPNTEYILSWKLKKK